MLERLVTGRHVVIALATSVAATVLDLAVAAPVRPFATGGRLLDETFGYTAALLYGELDRYGPEGRDLYASFLVGDSVYAPVYAIALAVSIGYAARRVLPTAPLARWLAAVPLATGAADWLEDGALGAALLLYPERLDGLVAVASGVTMVKLLLAWTAVALTVVGVIGIAYRILRERTSS